MRSIWRSGFAASVIVLLVAAESVMLPSAAQQIDLAASQKRFQDLYEAGNYSAALAEAQKTEAAAKRAGTNNFAYVSALNDLARAHQALGRYPEAAGMFKQVLSILQKNAPPTDPSVAQALANLATVYLLQSNSGEAEKLYKQALDITMKAKGANDPGVALLMRHIGAVYQHQTGTQPTPPTYQPN